MESLRRGVVGVLCAVALMACGGSGSTDGGIDSGIDSGSDSGVCAATCLFIDAGAGPEVVLFRLTNTSSAALWVPRNEWFGTICMRTFVVTTCVGGEVSARRSGGELCDESLVRLAPDASVDVVWADVALVPWVPASTAVCGRSRPQGNYRVRFSYSVDGGTPLLSTADVPFVLGSDAIIPIRVP